MAIWPTGEVGPDVTSLEIADLEENHFYKASSPSSNSTHLEIEADETVHFV